MILECEWEELFHGFMQCKCIGLYTSAIEKLELVSRVAVIIIHISISSLSETKVKEPNFTLRRIFKVENTGLLPIYIRSAEINGKPCEGYGFKVLNCQEFTLKPNASKDLVIL